MERRSRAKKHKPVKEKWIEKFMPSNMAIGVAIFLMFTGLVIFCYGMSKYEREAMRDSYFDRPLMPDKKMY